MIDFIFDYILCLPLEIADWLKDKPYPTKVLRILCLLWFMVWFLPVAVIVIPLMLIGMIIEMFLDI